MNGIFFVGIGLMQVVLSLGAIGGGKPLSEYSYFALAVAYLALAAVYWKEVTRA